MSKANAFLQRVDTLSTRFPGKSKRLITEELLTSTMNHWSKEIEGYLVVLFSDESSFVVDRHRKILNPVSGYSDKSSDSLTQYTMKHPTNDDPRHYLVEHFVKSKCDVFRVISKGPYGSSYTICKYVNKIEKEG